jgi:zinc finger HIT domain-containing protein 1
MPLVEVIGTSRSHATPGWAYIPDTRNTTAQTSTTGRKRGIREPGRTDLTSRQNHAIIRHLAELDRENHRDNVHVPIPVRKDAVQRENGRAARAKTTSNVRRIMQSQKTFRNYLDDEEAAMAQMGSSGGPSAGVAAPGGTAVSKVAKIASRRSVTPIPKQEALMTERQKRAMARKSTTTTTATGKKKGVKTEPKVEPRTEKPQEETDAMEVDEEQEQPLIKGLIKTPHDNLHLLKSYIPNPPSDRLMAALLAEPPLRYHAARAGQSTSGKPTRYFCTICGYWGKIKCRSCGVRTCGLECYKVHEDSRCGAFF